MRDFDLMREFLYRRMRGHEAAPVATTLAATAMATDGDVVALLRAIQSDLEATRRAVESKV
jgi:hypothetical protein